jgi:hypothetical protein
MTCRSFIEHALQIEERRFPKCCAKRSLGKTSGRIVMKFTSLWRGVVLAAALAVAAPAMAQTYDGDWEGVLQTPSAKMRLVLHVKTAAGATTAVLESPDQNSSFNSSGVTTAGDQIDVKFLEVGGELKAKLSADGKTLAGTWSQGQELPLTLTKKAAAAK